MQWEAIVNEWQEDKEFLANLCKYLGEPPDELDPPNPNCVVLDGTTLNVEESVLRFNRKKLIADIYETTNPVQIPDEDESVMMLELPTEEQLEKWSQKELASECRKRGFHKAPYCFKTVAGHDIRILSPAVASSMAALTGTVLPHWARDGLPPIRKCTKEQLKGLMGLLMEDPRFKLGQPVVVPSYFSRQCEDIGCVILFWLFWCCMIVVAMLAYFSGDPLRLIRPTDYNGNTCGDPSHASTKDNTRLYYPQLPEDSLKVMQDGNLDCADTYAGCFYGVCVPSCPKPNEIVCNYETQLAIDILASPEEKEAKKKVYASVPSIPGISKPSTQKCWFTSIAQVDIAFRCFPFARKESEVSYECISTISTAKGTMKIASPIDVSGMNNGQVEIALAKCSGTVRKKTESTEEFQAGTSSLSSMLNGVLAFVEQIFSDISNSFWPILITGPLLSGLCSFGFIIFMMYFPGLIIWGTILALQLFSLLLSLFLFLHSGIVPVDFSTSSNATGVAAKLSQTVSTFAQSYHRYSTEEIGLDSSSDYEWLWKISAWASLVFTILVVIVPCTCLRRQINMCIALVMEAAKSVKNTKGVLLYPFFGYFWMFVILIYFLVTTAYILSSTMTMDDLSGLHHSLTAAYDAAKSSNSSDFDMTSMTKDFKTAFQQAKAELQAKAVNATYSKVDFSSTPGILDNPLLTFFFAFNLFGYLWTIQFIQAVGQITIAGAIAVDYWVPKVWVKKGDDWEEDEAASAFKPQKPVVSSFYRVLRFHVGTACFGSLIIAVVQFIRYVMMYVDHKTADLQKDNFAVKVLMKVVHCFLWCLEKCLRYITASAYIMVALEGKSFCTSAWRSFKLLFSNSLTIATTQGLASVIILLAEIGISCGCTFVMLVAITYLPSFKPDGTFWVDSPIAPCILVFIGALVVTKTFLDVYKMAISTVLMSFCLDENKYKKGLYKEKVNARGEPDKRMFCIINKKIGLIKLCSKSALAEVEKLRKAEKQREATETNLAILAQGKSQGAPSLGSGSARIAPSDPESASSVKESTTSPAGGGAEAAVEPSGPPPDIATTEPAGPPPDATTDNPLTAL